MTQTVLIGFSTLTRVTLFTLAGVYANQKILWLAALMFPAMIIGVYIGRHITIHLTKEQFLKIINILIFFSGCMLLGKYFL